MQRLWKRRERTGKLERKERIAAGDPLDLEQRRAKEDAPRALSADRPARRARRADVEHVSVSQIVTVGIHSVRRARQRWPA